MYFEKVVDVSELPAPEGKRKIVLATDIAESALTIEGVRIVIDSGLSRVAEDNIGGLGSRLSTVRASRASVDQRRGRAGRLEPGVCYRLWDEEATRGLIPAPVPEILSSDLSGLVLTHPHMPVELLTRLARAYGTRARALLGAASC